MLDLRRVDLHTHTYYSDGALSPYELVRLAKSRGIAALAVTDHDTVDGLPEAADAGEKFGVEVVNGVEMSVTLGEQELHLLGYFFDPENEGLRRHFEYFSIERKKRVERMVERLRHLGITLDLEKILARAGVGAPGRPHVAAALVEAGYVETYQEAFDRFLRDEGAAYVSKPHFEARVAIEMLHDAGGICVLAHPGHWTSDETVDRLLRSGLDGIEVIHPAHDLMLTQYYRQLAQRQGLIETGGSDYHGLREDDEVRLGQYSLPYPHFARLMEMFGGR
jgi:predicted metal-dependent phosphoesterase TrpH